MTKSDPDDLIFTTSPDVMVGSNRFTNCQIILRYGNVPIIEVVQEVGLGYTTQFRILDHSGKEVARAKGARLFDTVDGGARGYEMRHTGGATVCERNGKRVFEVRRTEAAAIAISAELYAPDGRFIRISPYAPVSIDGKELRVGGIAMSNMVIKGAPVAIQIGAATISGKGHVRSP